MWRQQAGMGALSRASMLVPPVQASSPQSGGEEGLLLSTSGQPEQTVRAALLLGGPACLL